MGPDTSTMLEQDESSSAQASINEISVPRLRPLSLLRQKPCNGIRLDVTTSTAAPTIPPASKPYSRRSPSKARRKSIDGRPLIRSTTKISVRMKPRPAAATPTTAPAPTPTTSALLSPASSPSRRGRSSAPPRKVSSSYLRKVSCPSPRNVSIKAQGQDSDGGSPVGGTCAGGLGAGCDQRSSRAAGALRPRYSVSYRLAKAPRAAAAAAVPTTEPPPAEPLVEMSAEVQTRQPSATATKDSGGGGEGENRSSIPAPPEQLTPLSGEAMRLEAAWIEVQRRERQLEAREDALKLGQKRLRQDREALEKEKQRFQEKLEAQQEQQKTRTTTVNATAAAHDEDNLRKRREARRGRSRSKPRSKVVLPDDSWRRDHRKHQQQQDYRHSSWSSVNSSDAGTNASRHSSTSYPSDADSVTTATTRASSSSSSFSPSPRSFPNPQSEPKPRPKFKPAPAPPRTWSPIDLVPSLTAYNTRWTSLSPYSAHIPYPSPNHTAAELVDATHLRSLLHLLLPLPHAAMEERRRMLAAIVAGGSSGNHHDAVVQYNVVHFFLVARGVACRPVLSGGFGAAGAAVLKPDYGFGLRRVPVDGKDGVTLRALVKEVRGELRRWHEDGLKYRGGEDENGHRHAERKINEELVKDETAKAVFRAFTELRDELLAEVRWRKDIATAAGDGFAGDTRREERPRSGYGNGPEEDQNGGGVDWSVLSEAML